MKARSYIAGIDGGASKTVALIANGSGTILGEGRAGSSNYHNVGTQAATLAIKNSLQRAKSRAGITGRTDTAVVALAAIDSEQDLRTASQFVKKARIANTSIVIHDSVAAIYAAMKGRPGIVVNSGTGSFAAGINSKGAYARAGGWGYIVGDEGSAYDIGLNAIKMGFRSFDGREKNTELTEILRQRFRIKKMDDLISQIYSHKLSVEQIAAVAPLVIRSARKDRLSRRILDEAGTQLGELVCAVAVRLHMTQQEFSVAAVGGNFRSEGHLIQALRSKIRSCCPFARVIHMRIEPAHGALSIALEAFRKRN